jgi:hypothetical protein
VDAGWEDVDNWCGRHPEHRDHPRVDLASDVLTLKGLADLGSDKTDTCVLLPSPARMGSPTTLARVNCATSLSSSARGLVRGIWALRERAESAMRAANE